MNNKILYILLFIIITSFYPLKSKAENTFPVNEAGISAYLKINESGQEKLAELLYFREEIIEQKETHVVISFEMDIEIDSESSEGKIEDNTYPLIYLNTDGWMVAYYPKNEPTSSIMQWSDYSLEEMPTTILEDTLIKATDNIEATFQTPINYYHFAHPDANRISLASKTINHPSQYEESFSVIIPGVIHEVSYFFYHSFHIPRTDECYIKTLVDDLEVDQFSHYKCNGKGFNLDFYEKDIFKENTPHLISLSVLGREDVYFEGGIAVAFIYQVE